MTGHDQSMHCPLFSRPSQMQCMQCAAECDRATARAVCRKCFMFHLTRSIARVDLRRWCDHASAAIDRKCFDCKQTTLCRSDISSGSVCSDGSAHGADPLEATWSTAPTVLGQTEPLAQRNDRKIDLLLSENISTLCLAEGYNK